VLSISLLRNTNNYRFTKASKVDCTQSYYGVLNQLHEFAYPLGLAYITVMGLQRRQRGVYLGAPQL